MKHKLLTGYYDRYCEVVEELSDEMKLLELRVAFRQNYNYYIGHIALVSDNFLVQGMRLKNFELSVGQDYYFLKKYNKGYKLSNKEDSSMFLKKLYEISYIDYFQNFEVYIGQIIKTLYWYNPILLDEKFKNKYNNIKGDNKVIERELLIDKKVSDIMRKNIVETIEELSKMICGDNDSGLITEDEKLDLLKTSYNRNLIIHNSGIVNRIHLEKLKRRNIEINHKLGEYIFENSINNDNIVTNEISDLIDKIVNKIDKALMEYI